MKKFIIFASLISSLTRSLSIANQTNSEPYYNTPNKVLIQKYDSYDEELYTCYPEVRVLEQIIDSRDEFDNGYDIIRINQLYDHYSTMIMNDANANILEEKTEQGDRFYTESNSYPFNFNELSMYQTYCVVLIMDIKIIHDGYQHFYIYDGSSENANLLLEGKYSGEINTTYKTVMIKFEIPISSLSSQTIYVRYGASGFFRNDWCSRIVKVSIGLSNERALNDMTLYYFDAGNNLIYNNLE